MWRRSLWLALVVPWVFSLVSCAGTDEQAIRHVLIAEFIERAKVGESQVEVREIEVRDREHATAEVKVLRQAGRSGEGDLYRCRLQRESERWVVREVQLEDGSEQ